MAKLIEITGKAISGEWGNDDETGNGIPVLRTTNFTNTGIVDFSNVVTRDIQKKNISDKYLLNGDIIIEKSGGSDTQPVGRVIFFEAEENKYLFNNFTGLLRVKDKSVCYPKYLFYYLFSNYQKGGTIPFQNKTTGLHNLKTDDYVRKCEVPLPPLETQRKIASDLDKVTHTIDLCNAILEKLDLLVKSRFVEMFGDVKLNSKGLDTIQLEKLADVGSSRRVFVEDLQENGIPFYRGTEIGALADGKDIIPELFITEEHYNELKEATGIPEIGDLLMPSICSDGRIWLVNTKERFYFKDGRVLWIHPVSEAINSVYLLYFLKQKIAVDYSSIASGTTFAELKIFALKGLQVFVPTIEQQEQFAAFVERTDKSKLAVKKLLEKAETLKKALMQEYFG